MKYRATKLALNEEVEARLQACFVNLCQAANKTPWGVAYRAVMAEMKGA